MNCAEFHKILPSLIETGTELDNDPHLAGCESCSSLVKDLKYIAEQAKLLLPMHDPSPRVWNNIQESLGKEGLTSPSRRPSGHLKSFPQKTGWPRVGWAAALAAALLVTIGLLQISKNNPDRRTSTVANNTSPAVKPVSATAAEDDQLLNELAERDQEVRSVYERNLRNVNTSIQEARQVLTEDPGNMDAQYHLQEAYAQKSMLYQMATSRSYQGE